MDLQVAALATDNSSLVY